MHCYYHRVVFTSDARRNREIYTRINTANVVLHEPCRFFKSVFVPNHHVWSWMLGKHWKGATSSTSGSDGNFAQSLQRDTWCQRAQLWNSYNLGCRATSSHRDPSHDGSATWPECPRKDWRAGSCWPHPRETGPEVEQGPRWFNCTSYTWSHFGVELAELSEVAENREVFRDHLGLLFPRPSREEKRVWTWIYQWTCLPVEISPAYVFFLANDCSICHWYFSANDAQLILLKTFLPIVSGYLFKLVFDKELNCLRAYPARGYQVTCLCLAALHLTNSTWIAASTSANKPTFLKLWVSSVLKNPTKICQHHMR